MFNFAKSQRNVEIFLKYFDIRNVPLSQTCMQSFKFNLEKMLLKKHNKFN